VRASRAERPLPFTRASTRWAGDGQRGAPGARGQAAADGGAAREDPGGAEPADEHDVARAERDPRLVGGRDRLRLALAEDAARGQRGGPRLAGVHVEVDADVDLHAVAV